MGLKSAYLVLYNSVSCAAWAYVLGLTLSTCTGGNASVWSSVELPLKIAQTAAVMEPLHAALGLVRSPLATAAMQVYSRLFVVWGVLHTVPAAATQHVAVPGVPDGALPFGGLSLTTCLIAWCVTEVIRYAFYATKEIGEAPYVITWLRYTTFIVLYPLGVSSELALLYLAYPTIKEQRPYSLDMPNAFNFAFDYPTWCLITAGLYLPGFPQLYLYMSTQRVKVLGKKPKAKAA
ncbi:unnamed protein product [Pedinophyceae sp. YPF-701]|nr:unnamed protein product [Pedinophyceae sp. YPF-701]